MKKRVGILTSGGDCPGLNATIRAFRKDYADVYGLNAKFRGTPLWSVGADG